MTRGTQGHTGVIERLHGAGVPYISVLTDPIYGGVSASLGDLFGLGRPIDLDLTYRYIDAGKVQGGGTPLPGSGTSVPREPFNYDNTLHTVSIGVRIPFSTY